MAGFLTARELGADGIEFDVHASRDGSLVVHHDFLLGRTNGGEGPLSQRDLAYLRSLDAGSWFSPEFDAERIPLLGEVLELEDMEFELELKGFGRELPGAVLSAVVNAGVLERTEFTGWNVGMLLALKREMPAARVGLFSQPRPPWMPDDLFAEQVVGTAAFLPFSVVHVYAPDVTAQIVERVHGLGMTVHANDAEDGTQMRKAIEAGVDRFSVNDVPLAFDVIGRAHEIAR
jgi:glycerophosphoryl diester phosphodiesterase